MCARNKYSFPCVGDITNTVVEFHCSDGYDLTLLVVSAHCGEQYIDVQEPHSSINYREMDC
jgi:hypothetical protein